MNEYIFTSESVTKGHSNKVCDMLSDAFLKQDKNSHVAVDIEKTVCHFGRTDLADKLKNYFEKN